MKKLIMASITAVVVIVVLAGTLIPILDDATKTNDTYSNVEGSYYSMVELNDDVTYHLVWDHTDPTHATVNDESITLSTGTTILSGADSFLIRFGQDASGYYLQSVPGSVINIIVYSAGSTNVADLDIAISNGTITAVKTPVGDSASTVTATITDGFGIAASGDYVLKKPTQKAYVLGDSRIYAMGLTSIDNVWYNGFYIDGTYDDLSVSQFYPDPATYTISNETIVSEEDSEHEDLYQFESVTFTATQIADTSVIKDCTYNYVIVPAEVTAERAVHFTDGENAIFGAIPVMIIIALLLGVVALVLRSRMD